MTGKKFLNSIANGETDMVQLLLSILDETGAAYCVNKVLPVLFFS